MTDALKNALDRFDVPPVSVELADRIVAAAATPMSVPFAALRSANRDPGRRGMWRRGRQVVLGTCAVALLSAGAVASGLLGSVGIEVPVLTAMLAPKPKPVAKPVQVVRKPVPARAAVAASFVPPAVVVDPGASGLLPRPLLPGERLALREERRERREAFAAAHPLAAAHIRERVRQQLQRRALERRHALAMPGIDPALPGAGPLDPLDRLALARAARRDRLVAEKMIDRRIQAREARLAGQAATNTPLPSESDAEEGDQARPTQAQLDRRAALRARLRSMTPEQRAQFRAEVQQRRAQRLNRQPMNPKP